MLHENVLAQNGIHEQNLGQSMICFARHWCSELNLNKLSKMLPDVISRVLATAQTRFIQLHNIWWAHAARCRSTKPVSWPMKRKQTQNDEQKCKSSASYNSCSGSCQHVLLWCTKTVHEDCLRKASSYPFWNTLCLRIRRNTAKPIAQQHAWIFGFV